MFMYTRSPFKNIVSFVNYSSINLEMKKWSIVSYSGQIGYNGYILASMEIEVTSLSGVQ